MSIKIKENNLSLCMFLMSEISYKCSHRLCSYPVVIGDCGIEKLCVVVHRIPSCAPNRARDYFRHGGERDKKYPEKCSRVYQEQRL